MFAKQVRVRELCPSRAWYQVYTWYQATMRVVIRYVRHFWLYLLGSPDIIGRLGQGYAR